LDKKRKKEKEKAKKEKGKVGGKKQVSTKHTKGASLMGGGGYLGGFFLGTMFSDSHHIFGVHFKRSEVFGIKKKGRAKESFKKLWFASVKE